MPARITILCGPARSGKTGQLLGRFREALAQRPPGTALWLAPTWRAAQEVRGRLLDGTLAGCFAPNVMTFGNFAEQVLRTAGVPIRPVTGLMKRELVRQIIARQLSEGRLRHFRPIAKTTGLVDLVCEFISELKRLEIWPDDFRRACAARGRTDKDDELSEIYDAYQQALREHRLFDAEGRFWSARDVLWKGAGDGGRGAGDGDEGSGIRGQGSGGEVQGSGEESHRPPPAPRLPSPTFVVVDGFTDFTRTQYEILDALSHRADEMLFTLPLESGPRRSDLFAKPSDTLEKLRRRYSGAVVQVLEPSSRSDWPAIGELERTLFRNPREKGSGVRSQGSGVRGQGSGLGASSETPTSDSESQASVLRTRYSVRKAPSSGPEPRTLPPDPSPLTPDPSFGIEILAAARQTGEIELIGSRVKRLLVGDTPACGFAPGENDRVRPGEIAVVFRSLQGIGELVVEVFDRLRIPFVLESGQSLDRSPALRALASLLQLDLDDWPFGRLLAVLGSNYFEPDWPERRTAEPTAVERTVRKLQIPRGRGRLLEQLAAAADRATLGVLNRLAGALDALPQRATLPDWADAWQRLAEETGLLRAIDGTKPRSPIAPSDPTSGRGFVMPPDATSGRGFVETPAFPADRRAWDRLREVSAESDALAGWLQQRPPELDRQAACETLLDILASGRIGHAGDESGRVRVLSAASVRSISIPYLFLAGLSERVFPSPDREDRLYSEAEFVRLIEAGLPLVARTERNRQEMLLFYEAVTRATKRLYLSYPALNEAAQPLLPSPFLREVEQVFGPDRIPRTVQADLSPIPPDDEPLLCEAELRVKAIDTALRGNVGLLAGLFQRGQGSGVRGQGGEVRVQGPWFRVQGSGARDQRPEPNLESNSQASALRAPHSVPDSLTPDPWPLTPDPPRPPSPAPVALNLAAGLELIWLRQNRQEFGPAEGVLQGRAAQDHVAAQFPLSQTFSATELERYAACPFRFFLERVLRVEPVEDLALELDAMARGRVVHDVLALLHQRVNQRLGRPGSPLELDAAEYEELLTAAKLQSLPPEPGNRLQAALREIDRRLVNEWLSHYREQCEKYGGQWKDFERPMVPAVFETPFGRDDSPSAARPLECRWKNETVLISGRIDRIDVGTISGETVFNVIDYKSGGTIKLDHDTIRAGTTLQLPLYALAAMELVLSDRAAVPWRAGYWYVRDRGFSVRQAIPSTDKDDERSNWEKWQELRDLVLEAVAGIVQNLRAGGFPVSSADKHCTGHCPYSTVCRINQVRSLEKTFQRTIAR